MIERLQNHPNIKRGTAGAALIGALAAGGVYKANAASNHEATTSISAPALKSSETAHDENMLLIRSLRASIVRANQSEAARDAARKARVEAAIPTPYTGPIPTHTPAPTPKATQHAPVSTPSEISTPVEIPAVAGQYFFGTGKAAIKFAKLGDHAHQIAQLEYNLGKQAGFSDAEIGCEQSLTVMESGNSETALNSSSGAYGLPQALPASKMATAGGDWRTNPATQIAWLDGYADARYGGLCPAWDYWQRHYSY